MNYLGIDWGKSKIGLAIGSDETKIALPILILSFHSLAEVKKKLPEIIKQENIDFLVVGRPINLAGQEYKNKEFDKFVRMLNEFGVEVKFVDERLTTKLANSLKKEFKGYKKVGDDDLAAAAILQTYFDQMD